MTKQISNHAHAAKLIRAELKAHNIKACVHASCGSMTTSVNVTIYAQAPWVKAAVETFVNKFQYGHFDGMTDMYEYSNTNDDLPQVKFAFVNNDFTDADNQRAFEFLRTNFDGYQMKSGTYEDHRNDNVNGEWVSTEVHQVLNGCMDSRIAGNLRFWIKPKVESFA